MSGQRVLKGFVIVSLGLFLVVTYDNTRQMAAQFHAGWAFAPYALAAATELGVVGCSVARLLRKDARQFTYALVGVLGLSFVANLLAGARAFLPDVPILDDIRQAWVLRWALIGVFAALIPVLIFVFGELLAIAFAQETSATTQETSEDDLVLRVVRAYAQEGALAQAKLALALGVSETQAQRARASALERGLLQRVGRGQYAPSQVIEHKEQ